MKGNAQFRTPFIAALLLLMLAAGCNKKDHYIYDVNEVVTQSVNAEKKTLKSNQQYLAILYANLFQKSLSSKDLAQLMDVIESVGDKETVKEVIISSFMNDPAKIIPTDAEMRADIDQFISDTYVRFLVRNPSEAEKTWFRNFILSDPNVTPELVYMSFSLSDEYNFY